MPKKFWRAQISLIKYFCASFNPRNRSDVLPMFGRPHRCVYKLIYFGLMCLLAVRVGGSAFGVRVESSQCRFASASALSDLTFSWLPSAADSSRISQTLSRVGQGWCVSLLWSVVWGGADGPPLSPLNPAGVRSYLFPVISFSHLKSITLTWWFSGT